MAIDTRNKRASVIGLALAARLVLPAPDGAVGVVDRPHVAFSYAGISAALPFVPGRICVTGNYRPTIEVTGSYRPTIAVTGNWSDC